MKFATICFLLASIFVGSSASAGIPYGTSAKIEYYGDTRHIDDRDDELSLCVLSFKKHIVWIGYWLSQEFVLAPDRCEGEQYYDYPLSELMQDRAAGNIDNSVPDKPPFGVSQLIAGFLWWPLGVAFLIWIVIVSRKETAKGKERDAVLGDVTPYQSRLAVVMCHAARADGQIVGEEVGAFQQIFKQDTGIELSVDQIAKVFELTPAISIDAQFTALRHGISKPEREQLLRVAMLVVCADGVLEPSEEKFIGRLGKGLGIARKHVKAMIAEVGKPAA